jgi:hypothetical protein
MAARKPHPNAGCSISEVGLKGTPVSTKAADASTGTTGGSEARNEGLVSSANETSEDERSESSGSPESSLAGLSRLNSYP